MKLQTSLIIATSVSVAVLLSGCVAAPLIVGAVSTGVSYKRGQDMKSDQDLMAAQAKISRKFTSRPDTDAWNEQRKKMALATGDRIFESDFPRVFDSLTLAVATLELKLGTIERQSGLLTASGIELPPSESKAMRREAVNEWCKLNDFDVSVLDRDFKSSQMKNASEMMDMSDMMSRYEKMQKSLTFQLVKMGDKQTKVKLRFSDVYYPTELETYYKIVWQAVDKQIFVDKNVEGAVEKRK